MYVVHIFYKIIYTRGQVLNKIIVEIGTITFPPLLHSFGLPLERMKLHPLTKSLVVEIGNLIGSFMSCT